MIRNLVFDFGNVLVKHDLRPMLKRYFGNDTDGMDRFCGILSDREFIDLCDRGIVPFDEMLGRAIRRNPEYTGAFLYFKNNYVDEITGEVEGMRELLETLKQSGFALYGLTNWSSAVYQVMERFEIFRLLDGRVISSEEHIIKPEREIYLRLCEKYSLRPSECLFADDRPVNVDGAKAAGMEAVVFTTALDYARDLRSFMVEPVG